MRSMFWDHEEFILIDFFPQGETVNSDRCLGTLKKFRGVIKRKRPGKLTKGMILHHDNARPHAGNASVSLIESFGWENMDHPSYSPDTALSDYYFFAKLKENLGGIRFSNDNELQRRAKAFLQN